MDRMAMACEQTVFADVMKPLGLASFTAAATATSSARECAMQPPALAERHR